MPLSHGEYEFPGIAGVIKPGPISQPRQTVSFPGVKGVAHIVDARKERKLTAELTMDGYATLPELEAALLVIDKRQGQDGSLTYGSVSFQKCTFDGFVRGAPQYSAGGSEGWFVIGSLEFTQRKVG